MTAKLAEVITLRGTNCRSIPDMLRQAADNIASEQAECFSPTTAMIAVQVSAGGKIQVYGWGDTNDFHALGALHLGMQEIGGIILDDGE